MASEEEITKLNLNLQRQEYMARLEAEQEEREPTQPKPKRLSSGIFSLLLLLSAIADIAEAITLGTLGWFIGIFVDAVLLVVFGFSVKKQLKSMVIVTFIETVPFLDILPWRTFYLLFARFYLKSI